MELLDKPSNTSSEDECLLTAVQREANARHRHEQIRLTLEFPLINAIGRYNAVPLPTIAQLRKQGINLTETGFQQTVHAESRDRGYFISRVPFGGCAALDTASAPCLGRAYRPAILHSSRPFSGESVPPSGCSPDSRRARTVTAGAWGVGAAESTTQGERWPQMPRAVESI
jgi:hypothetical protein